MSHKRADKGFMLEITFWKQKQSRPLWSWKVDLKWPCSHCRRQGLYMCRLYTSMESCCSDTQVWTLGVHTESVERSPAQKRVAQKARPYLQPCHYFIVDFGSGDHNHCSIPTMERFAAASYAPMLVLGTCYPTEALWAWCVLGVRKTMKKDKEMIQQKTHISKAFSAGDRV